MIRTRSSNIIFLCVRSCVRRPSFCPSPFLLPNHWSEFNHATWPSFMVGKCESNIILPFIRRPSVQHPSICLSYYLVPYNWWGSARATLFYRASGVYLSGIRPSVSHAILSQTTGRNLTKLATGLPSTVHVRVCESESVCPSVSHAISNIRNERGNLQWHAIDCTFFFFFFLQSCAD